MFLKSGNLTKLSQIKRPIARCFASSVRDKEIEFYSQLDDWWSPNGPQKQLHKFNKVRVNYIRKHLLQSFQQPNERDDETLGKIKALDIGCGAGILSESLGRLGLQSVHGIDPTPKCIELAKEHLNQMLKVDNTLNRVNYEQVTMEELIDRQETHDYDLVCLSEVIEHVNDQQAFLDNALKLVKPKSGLFFLSSIAKTPEGWFLNIFMGEKVLGLLPKGTHEYEQLICPETVEKFVTESKPGNGVQQFETLHKTGVFLANPLTMEMKEVDSFLRGNYMMTFKQRQDI